MFSRASVGLSKHRASEMLFFPVITRLERVIQGGLVNVEDSSHASRHKTLTDACYSATPSCASADPRIIVALAEHEPERHAGRRGIMDHPVKPGDDESLGFWGFGGIAVSLDSAGTAG
jgi:hypothetical protein